MLHLADERRFSQPRAVRFAGNYTIVTKAPLTGAWRPQILGAFEAGVLQQQPFGAR